MTSLIQSDKLSKYYYVGAETVKAVHSIDINIKRNTLIIVTHEVEIAKHAKRIIRLKDGIIEEDFMN